MSWLRTVILVLHPILQRKKLRLKKKKKVYLTKAPRESVVDLDPKPRPPDSHTPGLAAAKTGHGNCIFPKLLT